MADPKRSRSLGELAALVGGEVQGDAGVVIEGVAPLEMAGPSDISFFANRRYRKHLLATRAGAVILAPGDVPLANGRPLLKAGNPYLAFARISGVFNRPETPSPGIDPSAVVHPTAEVDPSATVMAHAYVGRNSRVGARTVLYPAVVVMNDVRIGSQCILYSNVSVRERCVLGDRVILQPGAVVGSDGFGFAFDADGLKHVKVPQAGIVRIEDDVEIGACSCVDRATFGETVVGAGTKVDNLVQIAHNVEIGPLGILCGQAGISGSTKLGAGVVLGGQVGITGHVNIGDRVQIAAQSGVHTDIESGAIVAGSPVVDHRKWMRNAAALGRLADLVSEVRALRAVVAELQAKVAAPAGVASAKPAPAETGADQPPSEPPRRRRSRK